jgi:2-polyprenyl-6-methoxyphenol hydroxylase-like FAD-dependent oxidoreductase
MAQSSCERRQEPFSPAGADSQGLAPGHAPGARVFDLGRALHGEMIGPGASPRAERLTAGPLDVIIVGGGLAGTAAAAVLARAGRRVRLLDRRDPYPDSFKAEKIEAGQLSGLRRLGLLDVLKPVAAPIREIWDAKDGRLLKTFRTEQLGLPAHEVVRRIRDAFPARSVFRQARVTRIIPDAERPRVLLDSGEELSARVIVMATGTAPGLVDALGVERQAIGSAPFSFAFGFDIEPASDQAFRFQSLAYYPEGTATRIGYLSLFQIPGAMRANLFSYHDPRDAWVKAFARNPTLELAHALPRLSRVLGPYRVSGKVHMCPIDLYRIAPPALPGVVLIGDAFQSVCPATGSGLSKIFTDVSILCNRYLPRWLDMPGLDAQAIQGFYEDPEKAATDQDSVSRALYRKQVSLDSSIRFRLHRQRSYAALWASGQWERLNTLVARVRR